MDFGRNLAHSRKKFLTGLDRRGNEAGLFHQGVSSSRVSGHDGGVHASEYLSWQLV